MKLKYLKESAKEYGKDVLSIMKWFIPASAGIIVLGALALEAEDETENEEASPNEEEQTSEETPVEESNEEVSEVSETSADENLKTLEKELKEE